MDGGAANIFRQTGGQIHLHGSIQRETDTAKEVELEQRGDECRRKIEQDKENEHYVIKVLLLGFVLAKSI